MTRIRDERSAKRVEKRLEELMNRKQRRVAEAEARKSKEPLSDEAFTALLQDRLTRALQSAVKDGHREQSPETASCMINSLLVLSIDVSVQTGCSEAEFKKTAAKIFELLAHGRKREDLLDRGKVTDEGPKIILGS